MNSVNGVSTFRVQRIVFLLNLFTLTFWVVANTVDVHQFILAGALFEILWLPMVIGVFALPIITIVLIINEKGRFNWMAVVSLGLNVLMFILIGIISHWK